MAVHWPWERYTRCSSANAPRRFNARGGPAQSDTRGRSPGNESRWTQIAKGLFQYTAIDDCTRYRVLAIYPRRTAANTLLFLEKVLEEMPFPVQRVQTDRGREFFALKVQQLLMDRRIKFRPIRPAAPHLNGKVERSQRTDLDEFYSTIDLPCEDLESRVQEWQHHYNWERPHGAFGRKTPMEVYFSLSDKTPFWDAVEAHYDRKRERFQESNYRLDRQIRDCARCL